MAKEVQVGGVRTSGSVSSPEAGSSPQPRFKHEYQSHPDYPALLLSLQERAVHFMRTGTTRDERPRTKSGSYTDMVRFENGYLGTNDRELAELLEKSPLFGMPHEGGRFWRKADMDKAQLQARAAEIRRELESRPELLVALKPGDGDDFRLPPAV